MTVPSNSGGEWVAKDARDEYIFGLEVKAANQADEINRLRQECDQMRQENSPPQIVGATPRSGQWPRVRAEWLEKKALIYLTHNFQESFPISS